MRDFVRTAACALLIVGLAAGGVAERHMKLNKSQPEADTVIPESPSVIQAWFSQAPELSLSRIALEGPDGEVDLAAVRAGEEFSLLSEVPAGLRPGSYTVNWRTAGDDGHVVRGSFSFLVGSTGSN